MIRIMKSQQSLSTLSLAILGLVSQQPRSGYDLRKVFSSTPMGHFSASPGAIYPALKRVEECGWVRAKVKNVKTLRPKQVYTITKEGREVLRQHVSQSVTKDDVFWHLDELLLRFAFMSELVDRKHALRFLNEFSNEVASCLSTLRQHLEEFGGKMPVSGRLALENGIEKHQMHLRWAKQATRQLESGTE